MSEGVKAQTAADLPHGIDLAKYLFKPCEDRGLSEMGGEILLQSG